MKVLIIKTSSLGDIIHANSIISDLRRNHVDAEIHWLVEESFSSLLNLFPIQKTLVSKFRSWKKNLFKKISYSEFFQLRHLIKKENYDYVIDLQGLIRTGIMCRSLNSFGFNKNSIKESFASYFYKNPIQIEKKIHAIDRNRLLVAKSMNYEIDRNDISFTYNLKKIIQTLTEFCLLQGQAMNKRNGLLKTGLSWHTYLSGIILKFFFPGEMLKNMRNAWQSMIKQQIVKFSRKRISINWQKKLHPHVLQLGLIPV